MGQTLRRPSGRPKLPVADRQPTVSLLSRAKFWLDRLRHDRSKVSAVEIVVYDVDPNSTVALPTVSPVTLNSFETNRTYCNRNGLETPVRIVASEEIAETNTDTKALRIHIANGVELAEHAVARLIEVFNEDPELQMAYTDAAGFGESNEALLLPGFSPERLADQMYLGQLLAIRVGAELKLSEPSVVGSGRDRWDVLGTAVLKVSRVAHVPERLYRATASAVTGATKRVRPESVVELGSEPMVSIIIPTCGARRDLLAGEVVLVEQAIRSVLERSSYSNYELVVVTTPGTAPDLPSRLHDLVADFSMRIDVVRDDRPFNFSNACNRGAVTASGQVLLFLNDDTEVLSTDWIQQLLHHALQPEIGAVGAKLTYENGTVQHNGIWCRGGHPVHRYEGSPDGGGYLQALDVTQNCLAVTGACLAVERSKFVAAGGFSPIFPNSYNDVDLCLKLLDLGWRTVVEPRARLSHYEASTRDPVINGEDMARLHDRWRWRLNHDPFDNPAHQAALSEELPLPSGVNEFSSAAERLSPRLWPLDPMVNPASDLVNKVGPAVGR